MEARQAIDIAKQYVRELFSSEGAANFGLEELNFEDDASIWRVTIGFTRMWDGPKGLQRWSDEGPWPRTFKTVEIQDEDGKILGLSHRPIAA